MTQVLHPTTAVFNFFNAQFNAGRSVATSEAVGKIAGNTYSKHNIENTISKMKKEGTLENISGSGQRGDPYYVALVTGATAPVITKEYKPFKRRTKEEFAHATYVAEKAKKEANATPRMIPKGTNNSIATELARLNFAANQPQVVEKPAMPDGLAIVPRALLTGSSKDAGVAVVWRGQEVTFDELRKMHVQLNAFFG